MRAPVSTVPPALAVLLVLLLVLTSAVTSTANDCEECDKTVSVLFEFNDGRWAWADVLVPEPANAWCATVIAAARLDLDLEYSFSQLGVLLEGVGDVDTPGDFSRYWGLWVWDGGGGAWESSLVGALDVDVDNDTVIAWSFMAFGDPAPDPTPVTRQPWLGFRGGRATSGHSSSQGPEAGGIFWAKDLGNGPIDSTLAVADGRVFGITAGIYDWNSLESVHPPTVFALDHETGDLIWDHEFQGAGGFEIGSPAYHGGVVYATSSGRTVMALDAEDGTLLWETEVDRVGLSASPAVADGKVLVGTGGGRLVALGTGDGEEVWSANIGGWVYLAAPAVHGDVVYIGTDNGTLHALSLENGTELWNASVGGRLRGTPLVHEGRLYVISGTYRGFIATDGSLHALDMEGDELWNVTIGPTSSSPSVFGDLVLVGSSSGLHAFAEDGDGSWSYTDAGKISSSPAVTFHKAYVLSNVNDSDAGLHSSVIALDPLGNEIWKRTLEPHNWALASVSIADGRIFVASDNGWAYSLGETTLEAGIANWTDGLEVTLASNGTATGVEVTNYTWHIGETLTTLHGSNVTHRFEEGGTYTVTLTITDEFGRVASQEHQVTVVGREDNGSEWPGDDMMTFALLGSVVCIVVVGVAVALRSRGGG